MKKFLTVLLALSVVFTYTVGTAFAGTITAAAGATTDEARLILDAAEYAKAQLPSDFEKAYKDAVKAEKNAYITEAAWATVAAKIVKGHADALDEKAEEYIADTSSILTDLQKYGDNLPLLATKIFGFYNYATLYENACATNWDWAVLAAKAQFAMDYDDIVAIYDKVDIDALYSKTTPETGNTYYEKAVKAIANSKAALKEYFFAENGDVQNVGSTVTEVEANEKFLKDNAILGGAWIDEYGVSQVVAKKYAGTNVVEYYYIKGIKTMAGEEADDALDAATTAAIKAQVAKNVAVFLKNHNATADKAFAEDYTTLYNYLAEVAPNTKNLATWVKNHEADMTGVKKDLGSKISTAVEQVKALEAFAAKYAAEVDATGALVRDPAEVNKLVEKAKLYTYANAVSLEAKVYTIGQAETDIIAMSTAGDAAKLAFDKEAFKADLDDELDDALENYYDLEDAAVKAVYAAAKEKVDAAKKAADFKTIKATLDKEVLKIKTKDDVKALFTEGNPKADTKMVTEYKKQLKALNEYVQYLNSANAKYEDAFVNADNSAEVLKDYYINNDARTVEEMKALANVVEAVAATLPTTGELAAAKKAANDAINALPSATKTTSADKAAYQNAFDLAEAYNDMLKDATGIAGNLAISADKVAALHEAIQDDFNLAYAKADKADKSALKAIAEDVAAANDEVGTDELFTTEFVNPAAKDLAKFRAAEKAAVIAAINALPININLADKAQVEAARALYDAYVAEYTDYDDAKNGYVADEFKAVYHDLALAEAELAILQAKADIKAVESLKIKASSSAVKGKITVKWNVTGDVPAGTVYKVYKSTKAQSGYAYMGKTTKNYMANKKNLKKGKRYFYKVKAVLVVDGVTYTSDWSNKANRFAK